MSIKEIQSLTAEDLSDMYEFSILFWQCDEAEDLTIEFDYYLSDHTSYGYEKAGSYHALSPVIMFDLFNAFMIHKGFGGVSLVMQDYLQSRNQIEDIDYKHALFVGLKYIKENQLI